MATVKAPKYVTNVLRTLESRGYKAFLVGGCVRDCIMGRHPNDWDVCTDALPVQIQAVFPNSRPTGIRHGTITVIEHGSCVEVTTFRSDGEYSDHRHPENVRFISDLSADLERRDFTINAMALPLSGILFDPFSGREDIDRGLIRCVGDPDKRFNEDALRMLRAIRFSATLSFETEAETMAAVHRNAHLASTLAAERVCAEIEKILMSHAPEKLAVVINCGLLQAYVDRSDTNADLSGIAKLPKNRAVRWAAACALLVRDGVIISADVFLSALRLDSATVRNASRGCLLALDGAPRNDYEWKKLLAAYGTDCGKCTAAAADMLYGGGFSRALRRVIAGGECYSLKRLCLSGDDLLELGFSGAELGKVLNALLDYVLLHPMENVRPILLERATTMKK